jgi:preprotein translocase subunit SecA
MNKQREAIYGLRREILLGEAEDLRNIFLDISAEGIEEEFENNYGSLSQDLPEWDLNGFFEWLKRSVPGIDLSDLIYDETTKFEVLLEPIMNKIKNAYDLRVEAFGPEVIRDLTRAIALRVIDMDWQDHLLAIDELREGIHLRAYAQRDPKIEYQREATELFYELMYNIRKEIFTHFFHVQVSIEEDRQGRRQMVYRKDEVGAFTPEERARAMAQAQADAEGRPPERSQSKQQPFRRKGKKIRPNDPCPCGSGKKYKKCCGRLT